MSSSYDSSVLSKIHALDFAKYENMCSDFLAIIVMAISGK